VPAETPIETRLAEPCRYLGISRFVNVDEAVRGHRSEAGSMVGKYTVWEPIDDDEAVEQIAVGIHIGLHKFSQASASAEVLQAISDSDGSSLEDAVKYCVWGLKEMGFAICRKTSAAVLER
jgi:hypothetical protein